jgi:hypothetical protein
MDEENELQTEDDDEIDGFFDWAVKTFNSGGTDLKDYTATLDNGTLSSVSDGTTTITF